MFPYVSVHFVFGSSYHTLSAMAHHAVLRGLSRPCGRRQAWEKRWDALGRELTCTVCLCLFVKPCTLPCQHSFCQECALHALRASADSLCPLCKLPVRPHAAAQ
eukprot:COSAG01_NODE_1140_length_11537_cov_73.353995_6_plen_104_part_00